MRFTGEIGTAWVGSDRLGFTYDASHRPLLMLDRSAEQVIIDGKPTEPVAERSDRRVLRLPFGRHNVTVVTGPD
jgi:hypothetical protein